MGAAFVTLPGRAPALIRRRRGLGTMNYYDLLAEANLRNCDPMDSACVSNNVAKQAAVEDLWVQYQSTGVPDGTKLTFTPQTAQEVQEFYNPQNLAYGGNVVDTRGVMQISSPLPPPPSYTAPSVIQSNPAQPKPTTTTSSPVSSMPAVISSSGTLQPLPGTPANPFVPIAAGGSSFDFSSIPWYVYAGGAALVFMGMGGHRGR
jgi:hypothetical protein